MKLWCKANNQILLTHRMNGILALEIVVIPLPWNNNIVSSFESIPTYSGRGILNLWFVVACRLLWPGGSHVLSNVRKNTKMTQFRQTHETYIFPYRHSERFLAHPTPKNIISLSPVRTMWAHCELFFNSNIITRRLLYVNGSAIHVVSRYESQIKS